MAAVYLTTNPPVPGVALTIPRAPIASPAFTGIPTAPTAAPGTSSTQLATTAFVQAALQAGLLTDLPEWQPAHGYTAGQLVLNPSGQIVSANTTFTSAATYTASAWTVVTLTTAGVSALIAAEQARAQGAESTNATAIAARAIALTTTAVQTSAYTTPGNEIIPADATAGTVPVTLPTAPADKTRATIKKIDATGNTVTVTRGGTTDVFNTAGGSTTLTLTLQHQSTTIQYAAASGIWYIVAADVPLSQLDARYTTPATVAATYLGLIAANGDGSINFPDTGWGVGTDGSPTFYGIGQVPAGHGAYGPTFTADGTAVLIPTGA